MSKRQYVVVMLRLVVGGVAVWLGVVALERLLVGLSGSLIVGSAVAMLVAIFGILVYVSAIRGLLEELYPSNPGKLRDWKWALRQLPEFPGHLMMMLARRRRHD